MPRDVQGSSKELFPSHSDDAAAAKSTRNTQPHLSYTINRPSGVRIGDFSLFRQAVSDAVTEANVTLLNEDTMQMTWKDGKPARMLRFGDLPDAPTGRICSAAVWGKWSENKKQEMTSTVFRFGKSGALVHEDVDGTGNDDDSRMVFAPLGPSDQTKTTRDARTVETKNGRNWMISIYDPEADIDDIDAALSEAPGTSGGSSTCTADVGEEDRGSVVAVDDS